jgi:hypothetical protein
MRPCFAVLNRYDKLPALLKGLDVALFFFLSFFPPLFLLEISTA